MFKTKISFSDIKMPFSLASDSRRNYKVLAGLSSVNRLLIFVLIQAVVIIIISIKLVIPQISNVYKAKNQQHSLDERLMKLNNKLNELGSFNRPEINSLYSKVMEAIPGENYYLSQFKTVKQFASQTGVGITDMQILPGVVEVAKDDKTVQKDASQRLELVVDAKIQGSLTSINDWVNLIETSLPLSEVRKFDFETKFSSSSAALGNEMKAEVEIVSYWSKLPSYLGKVDSAVTKLDKTDYETISLLDKYKAIAADVVPTNDYSAGGNTVGKDNPFP